jgi:hypothetical protein
VKECRSPTWNDVIRTTSVLDGSPALGNAQYNCLAAFAQGCADCTSKRVQLGFGPRAPPRRGSAWGKVCELDERSGWRVRLGQREQLNGYHVGFVAEPINERVATGPDWTLDIGQLSAPQCGKDGIRGCLDLWRVPRHMFRL